MKRFMCLHNLNFSTLLLFIVTFSGTIFTVSAELHQNILMVDATDHENWTYIDLLVYYYENNETKEDSGHISIECVLQYDAPETSLNPSPQTL